MRKTRVIGDRLATSTVKKQSDSGPRVDRTNNGFQLVRWSRDPSPPMKRPPPANDPTCERRRSPFPRNPRLPATSVTRYDEILSSHSDTRPSPTSRKMLCLRSYSYPYLMSSRERRQRPVELTRSIPFVFREYFDGMSDCLY